MNVNMVCRCNGRNRRHDVAVADRAGTVLRLDEAGEVVVEIGDDDHRRRRQREAHARRRDGEHPRPHRGFVMDLRKCSLLCRPGLPWPPSLPSPACPRGARGWQTR